ncbi:KAT8 regulatory NSL complex subunit 3 isoform X3 [Diabrotica virgifera virgifera]|uniref:KANSL3 helical domain-containing protein n=1 Tax=Diabrotica virgifera virgifera TaxID=50390 RepID=A0ABM5K7U0_DIAVI|nr:KAT8 regulatory NSL complex subunit 3 isoform X3 [Diabrotica virgifera virgifera]
MVIEEARYTYPTQLTNSFDRENWTISTEHCYARPWDWRPEASFLRPTKTLFMPKLIPTKPAIPETEELIDVEAEVEVPVPNYDVAKAKTLMNECENQAIAARTDIEVDWEELVSKSNWTSNQNKVFNGMVNILNYFNLSKLAYSGSQNEPLLRRTVIDKGVQRVRRLLASVSWELKLIQWLHQTMIENLPAPYLGSYLDILQTLKSKLPNFVDKMMHVSSANRTNTLSNANLAPLLEKPWDPVSTSLMLYKPKKLPGTPIILIVPSGTAVSKMVQKWTKLLTNLATVITIQTSFGSTGHRMTIPSILDQLFAITRGKIQDIREEYPGKHIILVGFNSGAALAMQVAQVEPVLCVVSIGFSLLTVQGFRGEPDDAILELQCPVLFVIGQLSNTSNQEDLENLREHMRVETGLLVVGCADDYLRITKKKKRQEGITQSIVNRCVVDEIGEFVSGLILSPYPPQVRPPSVHIPSEIPVKKGNAERKRFNSNTSSLDSEPSSPTPIRITRPVGRPPGSKTKNKLETKWAQMCAQGNASANPTSSSPTSPLLYPTTPDTSSNDSCHTDKPSQHFSPSKQPDQSNTPLKKIKTLKPIANTERIVSPVKNQSQPARSQGFSTGRNVVQGNSSVTNLLQGGIKTICPSPTPSNLGIKVLENVTLNCTGGKLYPNRTIDLSKLTLLNSTKSANTSVSNVLLLPDGKIKTIGNTIKGTGGTPILVTSTKSVSRQTTNPGQKYITSKKQLIAQKPPTPIKKSAYKYASNTEPSIPTSNLTTQDIMDLPIIFADDNQIINSNSSTTPHISANTLNSVSSAAATSVSSVPLVSQVTPGPLEKQPTISRMDVDDIENLIAASTLHKPMSAIADAKNIKIISKISKDKEGVSHIKAEDIKKRSFSPMKIDKNDPDYVPIKHFKSE